MSWSDCDRALIDVNFHSKTLGWERFESILLRVKDEIERFSGRRIWMRFEPRIRPRTMDLWKQLRRRIKMLPDDRQACATEPFFQDLEKQIKRWLNDALKQEHDLGAADAPF